MTMDYARQLLDRILAQIPLTRAMELCRLDLQDDRLSLAMPLPPNSNDKGTAFAGSLYGLLVLAAWGLVTAILEQAGLKGPVAVASSTADFRRPVTHADVTAMARLADGWTPQALVDKARQAGKVQVPVEAVIESDGKVFCRFAGTFAARVSG